MKNLLILVVGFAIAAPAYANLVISPGVSLQQSKVDATTPSASSSESSSTVVDIRGGYILPMGLYVGGMYSMTSGKNGGNDTSGFLVGPTVGYQSMMGFYTLLTYHIMGELESGSGASATTLTGAQGPQIDVGWIFPITSYFGIGPQMSWRSIEFDKSESAGTSVDTDLKATSIDPYVSLWFMF